ncbi:amidohydrolase family protein [Luteimonas sp. TWI1437]|uniref:amidohydrolase family protein n=1 Tax=unclassified Luteimonas TaxID=2629088 RepID=UPI0032096451
MSRAVSTRRASRAIARLLCVGALVAATLPVAAQDVLIRGATVHTAGAQGTLRETDVLVRGGRIAAVGPGLSAAGVPVVEAGGRPLTPTLFGGVTGIGIEEVSGERGTRDDRLSLGSAEDMVVRPEFDVTLAFNPDSIVIPVARVEGIGFTLLSAGNANAIVGGQGAAMRLDGSIDPAGPKVLYLALGSAGAEQSGQSRAAQWMLLDQLIDEARGRLPADSHVASLTPAGKRALTRYLDGQGTIVVGVNRASDIRQLLRWSKRHGLRIAIRGGAEAWKLAPELAAAGVPVFVDPLVNLPSDFDQIGATLENAARLHAAGVRVGFAQASDASHNARKLRQLAGNAVAHGLPWEAGLAGLTRVPAETFGVDAAIGTIAVGRTADLVLWSGDPLDVAYTADQVWLGGRAIEMRSRQTELRDRYLPQATPASEGGLPRAYRHR